MFQLFISLRRISHHNKATDRSINKLESECFCKLRHYRIRAVLGRCGCVWMLVWVGVGGVECMCHVRLYNFAFILSGFVLDQYTFNVSFINILISFIVTLDWLNKVYLLTYT